ncbi:MAG TPA: ferritin-like domain-containing protein [Lacunisphaera sp.]|jgi:ferritin-like metal-binding protein YciE|nr:ferritin-like domain-containing protein [Lacunisphaera sp.]
MPSINSLHDLLIDELKDLHNAEKQLVKALPRMAEAATNLQLKQGFLDHLEETRGHVERIEKVFAKLGTKAQEKTCKAMQGLIAEGAEAIELEGPASIRDACLIGAAQRVEHYEMAAYGTARSMAETLGEDEVADLLQETLDEEGETDHKLTAVASSINEEASMADEDAAGPKD